MKKLIQLIASIFIVISMTACSSNQVTNNTSTKTTETKQLLDLSGKWIQEIKKDEGYVAAEIRKDGQIGVFINLKNDEIPWTYWVGTYDAPKDSKDEYKWTSKNTYTGNGLMASNDKEKEFTYKDGKISFSYTIQGKTVTINLVRGDWETKIFQVMHSVLRKIQNILQKINRQQSQRRMIFNHWKSEIMDGISLMENTYIIM